MTLSDTLDYWWYPWYLLLIVTIIALISAVLFYNYWGIGASVMLIPVTIWFYYILVRLPPPIKFFFALNDARTRKIIFHATGEYPTSSSEDAVDQVFDSDKI